MKQYKCVSYNDVRVVMYFTTEVKAKEWQQAYYNTYGHLSTREEIEVIPNQEIRNNE